VKENPREENEDEQGRRGPPRLQADHQQNAAAEFDYDDFMRVIPFWLKTCVKLDTLLSSNIWVKEILNILLRPFAGLEILMTPVRKATAIMLAARRAD